MVLPWAADVAGIDRRPRKAARNKCIVPIRLPRSAPLREVALGALIEGQRGTLKRQGYWIRSYFVKNCIAAGLRSAGVTRQRGRAKSRRGPKRKMRDRSPAPMSRLGLGCVKTPGRYAAIEQVIRSRPSSWRKRASALNLENELKNVILPEFRSFAFSHSRGQSRRFAPQPVTSGLSPTPNMLTDVMGQSQKSRFT